MLPSKISISKDAGGVLRALAQRARLTPNLLARMALAISLEAGTLGQFARPGEGSGQEFNTYTLLGTDQDVYLALVELVEGDASIEPDLDRLIDCMVAHIERGISQIALRVKTPGDVARLMDGAPA